LSRDFGSGFSKSAPNLNAVKDRKTKGGLRMTSISLLTRIHGYYIRKTARLFFKRPAAIHAQLPYISFTFDDFPRSALLTGGAILKRFGLTGTYFACFGLMGKQAPVGNIFLAEDLKELIEQGHELGCHTFDHYDSWKTNPSVFENSVIENRRALNELIPGASFKTFSYPINPPRARTKRRVGRHFLGCRGGGQTFNVGTADLNHLSAYFLEKSRNNPKAVKDLIDQNRQARGWLILATHDVCANPSPFGCTPEFFEEIVQYAVSSGARILPVAQALEALGAASESGNSIPPSSSDRNLVAA
jgi:peptidoglycan/xylan/chitin deacetylase (PgdA/CDA1 family)